MPTNKSPADLVPEMARLTATLDSCEESLDALNDSPAGDEGCERWETVPLKEREEAAAERERLERELAEAQPAFDALLAEFRVETPAEAAACAEALASVPSDAATTLAKKLLARPGVEAAMVLPALEKALSSEESSVRERAWLGIVAAFGLDSRVRNPEGFFDSSTEVQLWRLFLCCHPPVITEIGAEGMRGLVRQLQAGASLESLGLAWKPNRAGGLIARLYSALHEDEAALPVEEIAQLTGADRFLAEALIALHLFLSDERRPAALARLGAKWTVPLLREHADSLNRAFRAEVTQALRALESAGPTPAERVRELEGWLEKIQSAESGYAMYEGWDARASSFATPEERTAEEAKLAEAKCELAEARPALDALLAAVRVETPAERAAWGEALAALDDRCGIRTRLVGELLERPGIDRQIVVPAFLQALDNWSARVRTNAWEGIIKAFDLGPLLQSPEGKRNPFTEVSLWKALLWSEVAALAKVGADEIRRFVERLRVGASPESLGIAWKPESAPELLEDLSLVFYEADQPLPVDELARLTGVDRRWAEAMIAFRLENRDLRAPEALAHLGAAWTVPALEEVGRSPATPPELREKIVQSLRVLSPSSPALAEIAQRSVAAPEQEPSGAEPQQLEF